MQANSRIKVCLVSLGCPKNLVDSEKMLASLGGACTVGAPMQQADVIVVNTCGFLSAARDESLGVIREALVYKLAGRARRVVVAGCLVNRDADRLFELAPGIDAIVGVNDRDKLRQAVLGSRRVERVSQYHARVGQAGPIASDTGRFRLTPRHTAYLRISEGCSQRCTFCTIPAIRGPFRSKRAVAVMKEARELVADGAVELNIIGQDTTSYGMDLPGGRAKLAGLLARLSELDARWIRLMYAYPIRFTDELIDAIASHDRIVPYVDLPLQHISDAVLRRMGRRVGRKQVEALLGKMRARIPNLVLRTTFIVGFPGETEGQFAELLEFVKAFKFDALGVFEYSPEEGTPSARMDGQAPPQIKADRARRIMLAQRRIALAAARRKIGQTLEVLVDGKDSRGRCVGRYYGQAPDIDSICILTRPRKAGQMVKAGVVGAQEYDLIVEPAKEAYRNDK